MTWVARVLYENKRSDDKAYPLHQLVCAMVDDELGITGAPFAQDRIAGMPRGGRDNLLRDCGDRVDDTFAGLRPEGRFALVDGDEIHLALDLAADASLAQRRAALEARYPAVRMFMPDAGHPRSSNTEGLLQAVASCLGMAEDDRLLVSALRKQRNSRNNRDQIFARAAWGQRPARDCIRAAQPTLATLVDALAELLRPPIINAPGSP